MKVEHAFGIIKRRFGFTKVRYRGLQKNSNRLLCGVCPGQYRDGRKNAIGPNASDGGYCSRSTPKKRVNGQRFANSGIKQLGYKTG